LTTASATRKHPTLEPKGLPRLQALVGTALEQVNHQMRDTLDAQASLIPEIGEHITASGGKRLRPMLALASAMLGGYREGEKHIHLAAAVECIHTATLLHDDVVDESHLRRGVATANDLWGNKAPILVGDYIFTQATRFINQIRSFEVLDILSHATQVIVDGEVMQLQHSQDIEASEATYRKIIEGKTAILFAAACEVGAVIAESPKKEQQAMRDYGHHLGMAFQMIDDALDYREASPQLGKQVGDDFREGKVTLPIILLYAQVQADERAWLKDLFEAHANERGEANFRQVMAWLERDNVLEAVMQHARQHADEARKALAGFEASEARAALEEAVEFCVARSY